MFIYKYKNKTYITRYMYAIVKFFPHAAGTVPNSVWTMLTPVMPTMMLVVMVMMRMAMTLMIRNRP